MLRGIAADEAWSKEGITSSRVTIMLTSPPSVQNDADFAPALGTLTSKIQHAEFVFLSQPEQPDASVTENLAELALHISAHERCFLSRVSYNSPTEDALRLLTKWMLWLEPPVLATMRVGHSQITVQMIPMAKEGIERISSANPEDIPACTCHRLLASQPPRCAVTGRKPNLTAAKGFRLGNMQVAAVDTNTPDTTLTAFATIPATSFDCAIVLGSPTIIEGADAASAEVVHALNRDLNGRGMCALVRRINRYGSTLHILAASDVTPSILLMVRASGKEDVLMYEPKQGDSVPDAPSAEARRAASRFIDSLPASSVYQAASCEAGWLGTSVKAIAAARLADDAQPPGNAAPSYAVAQQHPLQQQRPSNSNNNNNNNPATASTASRKATLHLK